MKVLNIPFNLVLLCALTSLFGSVLDISLFNLPFLILASITLTIILVNNYKFKIEYDLLFITFLITIIVLIFNVLLSKGFTVLAMGGYVILCSFLFQNIYFLHKKIEIKTILNFFNFFYKIFLILLVIEFFLIFFGYQTFLFSIFDGKPEYKIHNSFDVARFLSTRFYLVGGLNSVFLGSQIAGTMCLLSYIWFSFTKKINYSYNFKEFTFWKYLSIFLLIMTITGTNFLLLLILIALVGFKYFKTYNGKIFFVLILALLLLSVVYLVENEIIYSRIFSSRNINLQPSAIEVHARTNTLHLVSNLTRFEYYMFSFFRPLELWNEQNLFSWLFGTGNSIDGTKQFIGGDFAYGSMLLLGGFLFTFFFTVLIIKFIYHFLFLKFSNKFDEKIFQYFSLVAILLFFSLVHYAQAVTNSGIILFFAFHISLANLMIKNKIKLEGF